MPLIHYQKIEEQTDIYIWETTESLEELGKIFLRSESQKRLANTKREQDKKNYLAVRHILSLKGYTDEFLRYKDNGKPYCIYQKISISHSFDKVAVAFGRYPVGIDIEKTRDSLNKTKDKFIKSEFFLPRIYNLQELNIIWCIKEALYKLNPIKGLSFRHHLQVAPFTLTDTKTFAFISHPDVQRCYQVQIGSVGEFYWAVCYQNKKKMY